MTTALVPIPRRRTPARRAWNVRALLVGALPFATAVVCVATLRVFARAQSPAGEGGLSAELSSWMLGAVVLLGVIGLVALFDRRTRVSGVVALLFALVVNPLTSSIVLSAMGL